MRDIDYRNLISTDGKLRIITGEDRKIKSVGKILLTRQGEFFADIELGLNWNDVISITQKKPSIESAELEIQRAILSDDDVASIVSLEVKDIGNRQRTVDFQVQLTSGEIVGGGVNIGS